MLGGRPASTGRMVLSLTQQGPVGVGRAGYRGSPRRWRKLGASRAASPQVSCSCTAALGAASPGSSSTRCSLLLFCFMWIWEEAGDKGDTLLERLPAPVVTGIIFGKFLATEKLSFNGIPASFRLHLVIKQHKALNILQHFTVWKQSSYDAGSSFC